MGYDPKARVGVVVLSNMLRGTMDEIGPYLLNAGNPLSKMAPLAYPEFTLDTRVFDRYVGTYQFEPNELITVSREEGHFYAQLTGQRKLEVFAEGERKFFYKAVDAQLTFEVDSRGTSTQITLHQNGRDHVAKRLNAR